MFRVQIPARAEIRFEISAPPVLPSQLNYRTLLVGRCDDEGKNWSAALSYAEAKKIKSLTLHTYGCPKGLASGTAFLVLILLVLVLLLLLAFFFFFFSNSSSSLSSSFSHSSPSSHSFSSGK